MTTWSVAPEQPNVTIDENGLLKVGLFGWKTKKIRIIAERDGKKASQSATLTAVVPESVVAAPESVGLAVGKEVEVKITSPTPNLSGDLTDSNLIVTSKLADGNYTARREKQEDGTYKHYLKLESMKAGKDGVEKDSVPVSYTVANVSYNGYFNFNIEFANDTFDAKGPSESNANEQHQYEVVDKTQK